jgi:hypothetical protein
MEYEHEEREKGFLANLSENHELALRRISEIYREKLSAADKGYLQQKQTVSEELCRRYVYLILKLIYIVLFTGYANPRGDALGIGGEAHSRKASAS